MIEKGIIQGDKGVSVIRKDLSMWSEYGNVVNDTGGLTEELIIQLNKQLMLVNDLIASLKKEYKIQ